MVGALRASLEENSMHFDQDQVRDLVAALWEDAGLEGTESCMELSHLRSQLARHRGLIQGLTKRYYNCIRINTRI
jgi:hypothetical protein